ncbi:unnamed protein product [Closterium sp. NIES-54]
MQPRARYPVAGSLRRRPVRVHRAGVGVRGRPVAPPTTPSNPSPLLFTASHFLPCSHEHVIQWLGHFEDAQCVHIVQEWASGGDLFEELRASGGHMGEARIAKHILLPLLAALQHMHTKGVVHRDLKPENLLLTFHGTLKVRMPLPLAALAAATAGGVRGRPV